ncbi:hydrolase or acyltransferase of alpha/beta superfamily protein [Halogeometricum pallidum JCM 14848]|uniref:Hydrolase or acyltransferase of alpha/beta superfamily protein n=1 Tax=Halogeometricum pallidum JCM 14848 TaxID=1227487 RepID=M0DLU1_HALPD|nr:alpha/beta hydrolase [Halogeometricum pallidum]ELZ35109.1 hydrolase or acyltransferase of alpha/beta superfamily protein [Halogeometricum pallidum JCM 14848]
MDGELSHRPALESEDGEPTVRSVRSDDGTLSYAEYGDPDGVPVCFLHGTPGSRLLGGLFDETARAAGVRVLAPDRPGYGRSTPRPARTLGDAGRAVAAVLDDADVARAGLVGFSGGGPHALAAAATRGERVRRVDVVAGAVPPQIRSSPPLTLRALETLVRRAPSLSRGLLRAQAELARRGPPSLVTAQYTSDAAGDELPADVAELVRRDFVEAFARHRGGFVTETRLLADSWDLPFDELDAPVRLWHGDRDANVSLEGARRLAERLPDAELAVLDGADHLRSLLRGRSSIVERHASEGA